MELDVDKEGHLVIKTLFAQLRDAIKRGEVDSKEGARASAELEVRGVRAAIVEAMAKATRRAR